MEYNTIWLDPSVFTISLQKRYIGHEDRIFIYIYFKLARKQRKSEQQITVINLKKIKFIYFLIWCT